MEKQSERTVDITVPARLAPRIVEGWKRIDRYEPVLKRALETYGFAAQAAQLTEEVGELLAVLNQYRRGRATAQAVKSELADVAIMLMQMELHICGDDEGIAEQLDAKMERLEKRLDVPPDTRKKLATPNNDWGRDAPLAPRVPASMVEVPKVEVQPFELEGIRVGDLVSEPEGGTKGWVPVWRIDKGTGGYWWVYLRKFGGGWEPQSLIRKPIEVGDTVRLTSRDSPAKYTVAEVMEKKVRTHEGPLLEKRMVVAIAPTVKT